MGVEVIVKTPIDTIVLIQITKVTKDSFLISVITQIFEMFNF